MIGQDALEGAARVGEERVEGAGRERGEGLIGGGEEGERSATDKGSREAGGIERGNDVTQPELLGLRPTGQRLRRADRGRILVVLVERDDLASRTTSSRT